MKELTYTNTDKQAKCPCCASVVPFRSLSQNGLWWMYMTILGDHFGYSKEAMAIEVKELFNWFDTYVNKKTGEEKKIFQTSVKWGKKLFFERTQELIIWAGSQGIELPIPPDKYEEQF